MSQSITKPVVTEDAKIVGAAAEQLMHHLHEEQSAAESMLNALRDVNHALRELDDEALRTSLEVEARELTVTGDLQHRRQRLQAELATVLAVAPEEVNLRRLVSVTSGSVRDAIVPIWSALSKMTTEIEQLNRQNAAMIGQSLSIARGVVEHFAGVSGVAESYNATGARAESHVGPLVQWGG